MARTQDTIMVIGIGRFGLAVARNLVELGRDVIAIDQSEDRVQKFADELTMTIRADSTDIEALKQLGVENYETVVLGIGSDIEASIITAMNLINAGVPNIWGKAVTTRHGEILTKIGVHHVVYPERAMGERIAHVIADELVDYMSMNDGSVLASVRAPKRCHGTLAQDAYEKFGVEVIGVQLDGAKMRAAERDEVLHPQMQVIAVGPKRDIERFCQHR